MTALDAVAERVSRGEQIVERDAEIILESHDLLTIGAMADDVRRRRHGARATFLRVFEVHVEAPPSSLPAGLVAGEIRIAGRPSSLDAAVAAVRATCAVGGDVPVTGFSLADLIALASESGVRLEALSKRLNEAGLFGVAEVPVDLLDDAAAHIEAARRSGLTVARLTVHGMSADSRLPLVTRARDLQRACGGLRAFAPLPRTVPPAMPTTGFDDVKQVAIARLMATNIESIQVDWPLYGPKLAQVALTMGADDVDGVAALEEGALGTRRSAIEEIKSNIRAAALDPVERNGRFEVLG